MRKPRVDIDWAAANIGLKANRKISGKRVSL